MRFDLNRKIGFPEDSGAHDDDEWWNWHVDDPELVSHHESDEDDRSLIPSKRQQRAPSRRVARQSERQPSCL